MAILLIGTSRSECSNCRVSNVDPSTLRHDSNLGYHSDIPGCGEEFTGIQSVYVDISRDGKDVGREACMRMRPDLPYVGPDYEKYFKVIADQ